MFWIVRSSDGYWLGTGYWAFYEINAHRFCSFTEAKEAVAKITSPDPYTMILIDKSGVKLSLEEAKNKIHLEKLGKNHVGC